MIGIDRTRSLARDYVYAALVGLVGVALGLGIDYVACIARPPAPTPRVEVVR